MTMPEMALRFILNNPDVSTIIPGMRKPATSNPISPPATKAPCPPHSTRNRKHRWDRTPTKWSQFGRGDRVINRRVILRRSDKDR